MEPFLPHPGVPSLLVWTASLAMRIRQCFPEELVLFEAHQPRVTRLRGGDLGSESSEEASQGRQP